MADIRFLVMMKFGKPYLLLCCLFFYSAIYSQTVDFTYSTSTGLYCHPQTVVFTQACSGSPSSFIWRFGNGAVGSAATETVTYAAAGSYSVTLTVVYPNNTAFSVTKTVIINPTPTISITANRTNLCQPGNITFTAPGSAFINAYEWDFGDGSGIQITGGNSIVHFFNSYGSYSVSVKGITGAGCTASAAMSVQVTRFPISNASVTPDEGCIPVNSVLTASASLPPGDAVANYTWNFGDGSPNGVTVVNNTGHTYNITTPITTASVTITSVQGCTNQYVFPAFAFGTPPFNTIAVTADGRTQYCGSETIQFNGTATDANLYEWDFGDGNIVTTTNTSITHKYAALGNKTITLTPIFNGCRGQQATINIDIIGVIADYSFTNTCSSRNTFDFTNSSQGNVSSFRWTFSDTPTTPDFVNYNVSHTFPTNGSFTTEFYLYDAITGCSDSLTTNQFTALPTIISSRVNVCKDSLIQYTVLNTYDPLSFYVYEFHVAGAVINTDTVPRLLHNPNMHGTFNDFVVVNGPGNNTCNDTLYLLPPTIVQGPLLDFSVPLSDCLSGNSFPLSNNTVPFFPADTIRTWEWSFGDNTTSNLQNPPAHSYLTHKNYWISLKATDKNNCAQKDSILITVHPMPQMVILPVADTICGGQFINLYGFTADTLLWLTNYNIDCLTCDTVLVNPAVTTSYIAQATSQFGCQSYDTALIRVFPPFTLQVLPADTSVCPKELVPFRTNVNGIATWSPSTYLNNDTIINPISTPDSSIVYTIIVQDSAGCYSDTTTARINVFPLPTVNAGPDIITPFNTAFALSPAYGPNITDYLWAPPVNSLSCTACPVTSGIAAETATYTITVESTNGCIARDTVTVFVACSNTNLNLPSAFTPNNDGKNDIFYPMTRGYKTINKFVIYDRWGGKVFERYNFAPNTPSMGWKGHLQHGQITGTMVFIWMVEAVCHEGQVVQAKGTVTAIR